VNSLKQAIQILQKCGLNASISDQNEKHLIGGTKHIQAYYFDNMFSIMEMQEQSYWEFTHHNPLFDLIFVDLSQCLDFICQMYSGKPALPSDFKIPKVLQATLNDNKLHYQLHPFVNSQIMILGGKLHVDLENIRQSLLLHPMESSEEDIKRAEQDLEQTFRITCEGGIIIGQLNKYITENNGIIKCSPHIAPVIEAICSYYRTGDRPNFTQLVTL